MFRIADGEPLSFSDPETRGHSIEFRINAEDAGRGFLPAPGTITSWRQPAGPGVRLDAGYTAGMTVPQAFDSLIAKLIVTGATREQALERARRALAEFDIEGMPTVLPFHRAIASDPAFTDEPFRVHTRWIETEFAAEIPPYQADSSGSLAAAEPRQRVTVEVGGKRIEVSIPADLSGLARPADLGQPARQPRPSSRRDRAAGDAPASDELISPMQGTIVKIVAADGEHVEAGDTVVVLEAMKMEQPLTAHKAGTVSGLSLAVGQTVPAGAVICQLR
jgi:acetyl-CoA/propionyl-CoA carboxylase biotin carboxyl carrier protein